MSEESSCSYLEDRQMWPIPPHTTFSALAWPASNNVTSADELRKCCGGFPLRYYENGCLVWCEADYQWNKVLACVEDLGHNNTFLFHGTVPGEENWTPEKPLARIGNPKAPFTKHRQTRRSKIDYYVLEGDSKEPYGLEEDVEKIYIDLLKAHCDMEMQKMQRVPDETRKWFFQRRSKLKPAEDGEMESCQKLKEIEKGIYLQQSSLRSNWIGIAILTVICIRIFGYVRF